MSVQKSSERIDLNVPFKEKDIVKSLGAKFDWAKKLWFIPPGVDPARFKRWLPHTADSLPIEENNTIGKQHIGLSEALIQIDSTIKNHFFNSIWLRADIVKIKRSGSHVYIGLEERDEFGVQMAATGAMIWSRDASRILNTFKEGTDQELSTDMSVLVACKPQLHEIYGFKLIITDIDPQFTLGQLEIKKKKIRSELKRLGIYTLNKELPSPLDFTRVAVISPKESASLADFKQEALLLEKYGLCRFSFKDAIFEGANAVTSILKALDDVLNQNCNQPYDALVIIRGGGSKVSLSWLDSVELAKQICSSPLPTYTGIGHQTDKGILDEISNESFDTPSKVIAHIQQLIFDNGKTAIQHTDRIIQSVQTIHKSRQRELSTYNQVLVGSPSFVIAKMHRQLTVYKNEMMNQAKHCTLNAKLGLERRNVNYQNTKTLISTISHRTSKELQSISNSWKRMILTKRLSMASNVANVSYSSAISLREFKGKSDLIFHSLLAEIKRKHRTHLGDLNKTYHVEINHHASAIVKSMNINIDNMKTIHVNSSAFRLISQSKLKCEYMFGLIIGRGPKATLRQGYAIFRTKDGLPLTSKVQVLNEDQCDVEFHDGHINVSPISESESNNE